MELNREKLDAEELASCLAHYDIGKVRGIREFARGSPRSPKVVIETSRGKFLFKRRVKGRDDLAKVAFTHRIQAHLARHDFPLPGLVATKEDGSTVLAINGDIYEMFHFVAGQVYDGSVEATHQAGRVLGLYHKLLKDFSCDYPAPSGSYHNASSILQAIHRTVSSLPLNARPPAEELNKLIDSLKVSYRQSAEGARKLGLDRWGEQIVHGDWHPGNMLFRSRRVAAVVDYDSARLQQRAIDLANGALQFSIIAAANDPAAWPDQVDGPRLAAFVKGYASVNEISPSERRAIPLLMCEAMIAEAILPIAATGSFGRMEGYSFLRMIDRKVAWISSHLEELLAALSV
jgi:homoserine kinase type II